MTVTTELMCDGRVVYIRYTDPFLAKDGVDTAKWVLTTVYSQTTRLVHNISDYTAVTQIALSSLDDALKVLRVVNPQAGVTVFVTSGMIANAMASTIAEIANKRCIHLCHTLDEAWAIIDIALAQEDAANRTKSAADE